MTNKTTQQKDETREFDSGNNIYDLPEFLWEPGQQHFIWHHSSCGFQYGLCKVEQLPDPLVVQSCDEGNYFVSTNYTGELSLYFHHFTNLIQRNTCTQFHFFNSVEVKRLDSDQRKCLKIGDNLGTKHDPPCKKVICKLHFTDIDAAQRHCILDSICALYIALLSSDRN